MLTKHSDNTCKKSFIVFHVFYCVKLWKTRILPPYYWWIVREIYICQCAESF